MCELENEVELGRHLPPQRVELAVHLDRKEKDELLVLSEGGFGGGACRVSLSGIIADQTKIEHLYLCGLAWLIEMAFEERRRKKKFTADDILGRKSDSIKLPSDERGSLVGRRRRSIRLPNPLGKRWILLKCIRDKLGSNGKIELDPSGAIVVSPRSEQDRYLIANLRDQFLKFSSPGFSEGVAVETIKGVLQPDLVWSPNGVKSPMLPCSIAPNICVDLLEYGNSVRHGVCRRAALFSSGAIEYWSCTTLGTVRFHNQNGLIDRSNLFPTFPGSVDPKTIQGERGW